MHLIAESDVNRYVIQEADVLLVLEQWGFDHNFNRTSVMHADQKWVHSDTLGLIRFKDASVKVAQATKRVPHMSHGYLRDG